MNLTRTIPSLNSFLKLRPFHCLYILLLNLKMAWPHLPFLKFFQTRSTFLARSSNIVSSSFFYFLRLSFCYGHYFCPFDYPLIPFISFFFLIWYTFPLFTFYFLSDFTFFDRFIIFLLEYLLLPWSNTLASIFYFFYFFPFRYQQGYLLTSNGFRLPAWVFKTFFPFFRKSWVDGKKVVFLWRTSVDEFDEFWGCVEAFPGLLPGLGVLIVDEPHIWFQCAS